MRYSTIVEKNDKTLLEIIDMLETVRLRRTQEVIFVGKDVAEALDTTTPVMHLAST